MSTVSRNDLRNVAIVAHVDHGKTTLVDAMLRQTKAVGGHGDLEDRVMDSGDLEKRRASPFRQEHHGVLLRSIRSVSG